MEDKILQEYEVRKSNREKTEFLAYMQERLARSGYRPEEDMRVETKGKGLFKSRNLVVGDPAKAEIFLGAHYDTCALSPIPNIMSPTNVGLFVLFQVLSVVVIFGIDALCAMLALLVSGDGFIAYLVGLAALWILLIQLLVGYRNPHTANDNTSGILVLTHFLEQLAPEQREKVCVVYFDNEEKGLLGSDFFAKKHKAETKGKLLINIDCVGDGRKVVSLAKKNVLNHPRYETFVRAMETSAEGQDVECQCLKMKPMMFPSDQAHFDGGIGICSLCTSPIGDFVGRIHTPKDTRCREENVVYLAKAMKAFAETL